MGRSLLWWRRRGTQCVVETHFWSLTRYRIGRRFIGLDYADNVIFFPAYRKKGWGGWAAVTLGTTNTGYFTNDTSSANVLEDGYPLHWRASSKLQAFMAEEKRIWQKKRDEELVCRTAQKVSASSGSSEGWSQQGENIAQEADNELYNEQRFRDVLTIKCTSPGFAQRHLRLSRMRTLMYKALYFYLWGILISVIVQAYLMFRAWLNPPARAGLRNLEEHVLHIPKIIFSICVYGMAWLVQKLQPVVDPLLQILEETFPGVNWRAASPDSIASRAHHLVGNDTTDQKTAALTETRAVALRNNTKDSENEYRTWWKRVLLALLSILALLCLV